MTKLVAWLVSLRADVRLGCRRLGKSKVTSGAAVLSLALAIGACIAAFQLVDALLLRPLPVAGADRLYVLSRQGFQMYGKSSTYDGWEYPMFRQMRSAVSRAELIAISFAERAELTFRSEQEMEKAHVQYVSGSMFETFGLRPAAGRLLTSSDDLQPGAHPVAVLSHDYWSRRFARDPQVVGRTFRLGNNLTGIRVYRVIGVAQEPFTGTEPGKPVDIFMPTMMHWGITEPNWTLFRIFVHLHPGVSAAPVRDRLSALVRTRNEEKATLLPRQRSELLNQSLLMERADAGVSGLQKDHRISLATFGVLVTLVLLIACANVANLLTARATARVREMALRISIGAGRRRLVQLVLVESALLGLMAATIAWCFSRWAAPFVAARINTTDDPARLFLDGDGRVVAFGVALTLGVTLLCGLAPALRASSVRPLTALKAGDDPTMRGNWMGALIAVQAAFCVLVLFVASLFVATSVRLQNQSTGFSPDRLLNLDIATPQNEPAAVWDQVAERLRKAPGVAAVAYADWPLLDGYGFKTNSITIYGRPAEEVGAWFMNVSQGWVEAMGIPFVAGRDFRASDWSPGAAIVNESFATQFFPHENPLGKWFEGTSGYMRGQRFQIVGLVGDTRYRYLRQEILPVAYTPFQRADAKGTMQGGTLVVRTSTANPVALASMMRQEVARARPEFRVRNIRSETELIESQTIRERLLAMLARFFGAVALLLAGVGLYGVLDYSVVQRRREIGIRMALGARAGDIAVGVTARVFWMMLLGGVTGLGLGMASVRYIESLLYGVKGGELGILAIPTVAIVGVAILGAAPAVIHAMKIDPAVLLRAE